MSKIDRASLSKFLSKPRFVHEVAEHYGIPKKLADFHLLKAMKSGQVLISEKPIFQILRGSKGKMKRFGGFVYVFRNSPMLTDGWAKFTVRKANHLVSKSTSNVFSVRFLSKTHSSFGKVFNHKLSGFTFEEAEGSRTIPHHYKMRGPLTSEFDVSSAKVKLSKQRTVDQLIRQRERSTYQEVKSLSHVERIRLFQALLKEPLPFLDLHGRFGISKQTLRGLVKKGLLMETWGPKAVGVRFKLTNKGKSHLRELETAAKIEPKVKESVFIRLKQRGSF